MPADWVPITYREFYDVPRVFLVRTLGGCYLLDCPFDERADEYPDRYAVYAMPSAALAHLEGSWEQLAQQGELVGYIKLAELKFDETRRAAVDSSLLRQIESLKR